MKAVRDHQFDPVPLGGLNHGFALVLGDGHGLFAEHVNAGTRGALSVFAVHNVGEGDVHGVYLSALQAGGVILVRVGV